MKCDIQRSFGKFIIHVKDPRYKFGKYVSVVHKDGSYSFTLDFTYAKSMTKKTALKHMRKLESMQ